MVSFKDMSPEEQAKFKEDMKEFIVADGEKVKPISELTDQEREEIMANFFERYLGGTKDVLEQMVTTWGLSDDVSISMLDFPYNFSLKNNTVGGKENE